MKKKLKIIGAAFGAFVLLLVVYLVWIQPMFLSAVNGSGLLEPEYLFEPLDKDRLLDITFHPKDGKEYSLTRYTLEKKDVTDKDVDALIAERLADAGLSTLTDAFMVEDAKEFSSVLDLSKYSGEELRSLYRDLVRLYLETKAQFDAIWCVEQEGVRYTELTADPWQLALARTSSRMVYLSEIVATMNPDTDALEYTDDPAEFEAWIELYGFDDDHWVEVSDADGSCYKILVGDLDTTGGGYFVMLDGGDTIGITNTTTLGTLLVSPAASMVECQIVSDVDTNYAYYFTPQLSIYHTERVYAGTAQATGLTVRLGDTVGLTARITHINGAEVTDPELSNALGENLYGLKLEKTEGSYLVTDELLDAIVGLSLGECDIVYSFETERADGTSATFTMQVLSIDYVEYPEQHQFDASYLLTEERSEDAPLNIYAFDGPDAMTGFLPNNTNLMAALESIAGLEGTVVELGLFDSDGTLDYGVMEQYGLWRHRVVMYMPYYEGKDPQATHAVYSVPHLLFVSDLQPDGTYYVGSELYNLVAQVTEEQLSFVEYTAFDWVDPYMLTMKFDTLEAINLVWNYGDGLEGTWRLRFEYEETSSGGTVRNKVYVTAPGEEEKLLLATEEECAVFGGFAQILAYMRYKGDLDLTDGEAAALQSGDGRALKLNFFFRDSEESFGDLSVSFYPYSASRCMVVYGRIAEFYTYNTTLKTVAEAFLQLLAGETIDVQDRYPYLAGAAD